ncbi:MAG: GPR endopeptidase [Clostridium sp.]|nr:GPR endopeptidase [Clostridium sp.]
MDKLRTDLALEARELWQRSAAFSTNVEGVLHAEQVKDGIPVTTVEIRSEEGAKAIGKPKGRYVTLSLEDVQHRDSSAFPRTVRIIAEELGAFLKGMDGGRPVLVAGLGNRFITPDALGPGAHRNILVTRHLVREMPEQFGYLRPVASLAAEVLGNTGVESGEVVRAVCERIQPACVIAVDALASRSVERLCRTVQISDAGIAPGSGVGNHRFALNEESLGVPVIAIGVPTVVDAATLAADLTGQDKRPEEGRTLMVTPRDIDRQVADLSKLLGYGISLALQPQMTVAELELLLG